MARKDEEADNNQRYVSGSSDKYSRMKASESSPFHSNLQNSDLLTDHSACRLPMADVGNTEVKFDLLIMLHKCQIHSSNLRMSSLHKCSSSRHVSKTCYLVLFFVNLAMKLDFT